MPVRDYIAHVIEINDYLTEFPPTVVGGDSTKLSDDKLLDLLEFGIPIKWQRQMQVHNFEPTAGTLREFQDFCERLESALDKYAVTQDTNSKKPSGHEKGKKKNAVKTQTPKTLNSVCCMGKTLRTPWNSAVP